MSPIDNLERIRDDLEYHGGGSSELAIGLNPDRLIAVDRDALGSTELDLSQTAVRATVQAGQAQDALDTPDVSHRHHVEDSVIAEAGRVEGGARAKDARVRPRETLGA